MREKRPALVITFPTTAAAMGCESLCIERGLPGRTIPVPGEVAAGCGLAWKALPADEELLRSELAAAGDPAALVGEVVLPRTHTHHGQRGSDAFCLELLT